VGYTGNAAELRAKGLSSHLHFALIRGGEAGLADDGKPLHELRNWADYWQAIGGIGPVNPGLFLPSACWTGSTTVGAPGEKR
jgi:murein DD-endopeptidase MepM/ murein hydrolase activator NlpD